MKRTYPLRPYDRSLDSAFEKVRRAKGASGGDGPTTADFEAEFIGGADAVGERTKRQELRAWLGAATCGHVELRCVKWNVTEWLLSGSPRSVLSHLLPTNSNKCPAPFRFRKTE